MKHILFSLALLIYSQTFAQNSTDLKAYGSVYEIEDADFKIDLNQKFKAVFDIASISADRQSRNRKIETVARFLKMHHSPQLENNVVNAAIVIHGTAVYDLLSHEEYAKFHNQDTLKNPNYDLLTVLSKHDVDIILCGQTSKSRSVDKDMIHPEVKIALSAMSALIQLQKNGFTPINF